MTIECSQAHVKPRHSMHSIGICVRDRKEHGSEVEDKLTSPIVTASWATRKGSTGVGLTFAITGWPAMYSTSISAPEKT